MKLLVSSLLCVALSGPCRAASSPDFAHALSQLAAHKASYTLTLDGSPKGNVVAATGSMAYEVIDSCDGWATQQRLIMDVTNNNGQTIHMVSDYSTWEARNGSRLRFRVRQATDTATTLALSGEADFTAAGGVVHYVEPHPATVKLNPGTLFPMAHTAHILALAATGQKFITLPLFDGSSDTGAEDTFTVVTHVAPAMPFRYPALAALPSDTVNVAFFDQASTTQTPDYQAAMRYWTNGVADDLVMNFGDFSMAGKLASFTLSPHPC